MSSQQSTQLVFSCCHAPDCPNTVMLTLEEFRELGTPLCPIHHAYMEVVSPEGRGGIKDAVGMIMSGVTLLTAQALSAWPFRAKEK